MGTVGLFHLGAGRLSASEEVSRQSGFDGRYQEREMPDRYGPLACNTVVEVQGVDPTGSGTVKDGHQGGCSGQEKDGPRQVSVSDGFRGEEGRGRVDAVRYMVSGPCRRRSEDEDRQHSTSEGHLGRPQEGLA